MDALVGVVTQSLILGIMVLGVYISYKILDFPDLSVDGSFSLGGAIIAVSLKNGFSPITGCLLAIGGGLIAGFLTGILNVKLKISNLLSGILVMGILYSVNLRIMGKANVALFNTNHIFKSGFSSIIISLAIIFICKILLDLFLKTGLGYTLKAVGDNSQMVQSLGIEVGKIKILGLMISNGLVSFSGCIMAQYQGFSDVSMGIGTLVLGIACIIIGQSFISKIFKIKETSIIILGTILYQLVIYVALNAGLTATDLKLITSFIIILFLSVGEFKNPISKQKISILRRGVYAKN
ncbi:ABC transporter permease [Tepidibacter aestuarii]|uniref:ABC transporter permease n=1 Tax=Tepidibacter aestuarii TaxID=2925782 RepID=UPI0020C163CC|nr:ABC transporter permease [Tepidibacter aestuarii]CAH2212133.1 putative ABC transport system permease protein [Tepidibacter aestuarii]